MLEEVEEIEEIDLVNGKVVHKTDKTLLIDADTILFGICIQDEVKIEHLPEEFYSKEEWDRITSSRYYDPETNTTRSTDVDLVVQKFFDRINSMLRELGASDYEAHFTFGDRTSFRYKLTESYKANRKGGQTPAGLIDAKELVCKLEPTRCFLNTEVEADDVVVSKYDTDKHILCAVDKDVLYNLEGTHWNYFRNISISLYPKWVEVDARTAFLQKYKQTLVGDRQDGIEGLYRVGEKTADKLLKDATTDKEAWDIVVAEYEKRDKTIEDAILTMRLVNMHQYNPETKEVILWTPPS